MTYIIVGNNERNIKRRVITLISELWDKEVSNDILESKNPDIHIIESENLTSIGIEDVKRLQKDMIFSPYEESKQIAIIFNAEKLTTQAQNSFLKTLEESDSNTIYIFTTRNEKNLLPTVISRSIKIYTKSVKEQPNGKEALDFLRMDLVEAFSYIESIAKERDKTLAFLKKIELALQEKLEKNIKNRDNIELIHKQISHIIITRDRVEANGNRRLLLENLFLDLTREFGS